MDKSYYDEIISPYINKSATTCSYCDKLTPLIICESTYFYVTAVIGSYMEGYIQLCAKAHRTAATGVYSYEREELELMKSVINDTYKEVYQTEGIAFEHGQAGSCLWGDNREKNMLSLCHHMHIHYLPVEIDINNEIKELFDEVYEVKNIYDMTKVRTEILEAEQYLYFQKKYQTGFMYNVNGKDVPRQFLRICVANKLGIPEKANWIEYPGTEFFENTISKLKPVMESIYKQKINN